MSEGRLIRGCQAAAGRCFNPRPSRERGATVVRWLPSTIYSVSIRAPRVSEGRPHLLRASPKVNCVSIRAPRVSEGRPTCGDEGRQKTLVSIRAPRVSEGRRCPLAGLVDMPGFNPRPSRERGATCIGCAQARAHRVSIRAPRVSEGRPWKGGWQAAT